MIRLAVRVAAADAEIVLAELLELAPSGVEEIALDRGTRVEYAVYGSPGELPTLSDLKAVAGPAQIEVSSREVADDWSERWKLHHRPILIESPDPESVPDLWVRPPWERRGAGERFALEVVIDPGQAFGTGGHASTRLCLELLLALSASKPSEESITLDVGTGSGILAIAAARLGYDQVLCLDHDLESLRAAHSNAALNGVHVDVRRIDLRAEPLPIPLSVVEQGRPLVLLANLLRPLLLDLADKLPLTPTHLLAGGLLAEEVNEIANTYAERFGMRVRELRQSGDWAAVWLQSAAEDDSGLEPVSK